MGYPYDHGNPQMSPLTYKMAGLPPGWCNPPIFQSQKKRRPWCPGARRPSAPCGGSLNVAPALRQANLGSNDIVICCTNVLYVYIFFVRPMIINHKQSRSLITIDLWFLWHLQSSTTWSPSITTENQYNRVRCTIKKTIEQWWRTLIYCNYSIVSHNDRTIFNFLKQKWPQTSGVLFPPPPPVMFGDKPHEYYSYNYHKPWLLK